MSAYDEASDKEEIRDMASLAATIVDWAGGPNTLSFEEALVTVRDYWDRAAAIAVVPALTSLEPAGLEVPGPDSEVAVKGTGFNKNTVINWNGGDEATEFISDTELRTTVKPSTVEAPLPFTLQVYVRHGYNRSNVLDFTFTPAAEAKRK